MSTILSSIFEKAKTWQNPDDVKGIICDVANRNAFSIFPTHGNWNDLSLTSGYPSLVVFFAALDNLFPGEKWDEITHIYILKIKDILEEDGILKSASLYAGIAGICFAIYCASRECSRYQKLLLKLESVLAEKLERDYFIPLRANLRNERSSPASLYDPVQGIIGIGLYGLIRNQPWVEEIVQLLIKLSLPIPVDGQLVPGWYMSPEDQFTLEDKVRFPRGNFNLGLAHGMTGILAFLAMAHLGGIRLSGQVEAMERMALWLQLKRVEREDRLFWEGRIAFEDEILGHHKVPSSNREAWCYGTPGIARTLYLVGKTLKRVELQQYALESLHSILKLPQQEWQLPGPTFCHGISGLLMITHLMARDAQDRKLQEQAVKLEQILWQFYQPESPFGFCDLDPKKEGGYIMLHKIGLLEGATGVWLTLLSLHTPISLWRLPLLIDEI
ncbi:MAG: lanthionine synthetase C family protein [Verrucomicrobia bacterium]|nr:lanthionine synthetase C family protein [Verrucomicrobiota bacterium]